MKSWKKSCLFLCALGVLAAPGYVSAQSAKDVPQVISASEIALPTRGATISSVNFVKEGEYHRVLGEIRSVDKNAPNIHFQVNLPVRWNKKMVHFGGGGFNGTLVTAEGLATGQGKEDTPPLAQGYVTFGSDSGHTGDIWDSAWAVNDEALHNFAHEQLKKTKDVALKIVEGFYGEKPAQTYFIGGSNGGREALQAMQHYPEDYDGIVAFYPVLNWIPKGIADNRNANFLLENNGAGWLSAADWQKVNRAYLEATDELDGLKDGLVRNFAAAQNKKPEIMTRLKGELSPKQIAVLEMFFSPMEFSYPLANGFTAMPGYSLGQELRDNTLNQFGSRPLMRDGEMAKSSDGSLGLQSLQNPDADMSHFDYRTWQKEIQHGSLWLDATNPRVEVFQKRGGKLILLHGTADQLVAVQGSIDYYEALKKEFGQKTLDEFVRFYLVPGYGHGFGENFTMGRDMLKDLDEWVNRGKSPESIVVTDQNEATFGRMQVLERYPGYAHYVGGDVNSPDSFVYAEE